MWLDGVKWLSLNTGVLEHMHVVWLTQGSNVRAEVDAVKPRSGDKEDKQGFWWSSASPAAWQLSVTDRLPLHSPPALWRYHELCLELLYHERKVFVSCGLEQQTWPNYPKGIVLFEGFQSSVCKILFLFFFLFPSNVPHNLNSILKSIAQLQRKEESFCLECLFHHSRAATVLVS